ncbi:MAG: hypothetical protein QM681_06090 [Novosphingobium sp.]
MALFSTTLDQRGFRTAGNGRSSDVMAMAGVMMMRKAIVAICRHFVTVTGRVDRQLDAEHAPARRFGGVRHAGEAGEHQHQAGEQRKERSHRQPPNTPLPRRNACFSILAHSLPAQCFPYRREYRAQYDADDDQVGPGGVRRELEALSADVLPATNLPNAPTSSCSKASRDVDASAQRHDREPMSMIWSWLAPS